MEVRKRLIDIAYANAYRHARGGATRGVVLTEQAMDVTAILAEAGLTATYDANTGVVTADWGTNVSHDTHINQKLRGVQTAIVNAKLTVLKAAALVKIWESVNFDYTKWLTPGQPLTIVVRKLAPETTKEIIRMALADIGLTLIECTFDKGESYESGSGMGGQEWSREPSVTLVCAMVI